MDLLADLEAGTILKRAIDLAAPLLATGTARTLSSQLHSRSGHRFGALVSVQAGSTTYFGRIAAVEDLGTEVAMILAAHGVMYGIRVDPNAPSAVIGTKLPGMSFVEHFHFMRWLSG